MQTIFMAELAAFVSRPLDYEFTGTLETTSVTQSCSFVARQVKNAVKNSAKCQESYSMRTLEQSLFLQYVIQ